MKKRRDAEKDSASAHARALRVIRELTQPLVANGAASVELSKRDHPMYPAPVIAVDPTRSGACRFDVYADSHGIDLSLGPHGNLHEIWDSDEVVRLEQLSLCVQAIVTGRYSEQVDRHLVGTRLIGRFDCGIDPIEFRHYGPLDYGPLGLTRYGAYSSG